MAEDDCLSREIRRKRKYAHAKWRTNPKRNFAVLQRVKYQIAVCEELCIPVDEATIDKWLTCRNETQVDLKARAWKFAS